MSAPGRVRAAIVQAAPAYLDLHESLRRLGPLVLGAARDGAGLVVVGETWLPGYPAWLDVCPDAALWDHAPTKDVFARLRAQSLRVGSPECDAIGAIAREAGVVLVIGVNERVDAGPGHATLYNSVLTFLPDGRLANHHRKLVPTYTERLVWGPGDADGLRAVATPAGRVGALICWEHWMPLAREAMHRSGEQVHVALWPTAHEMHQVASRQYAFEGRCFVLAAGSVLRADALPGTLRRTDAMSGPDALALRGGSCIYGPDGRCLAGPLFDQEGVLAADLDLAEIDREAMTLDVTGHYARPDLFEFAVRRPTRPG